VLKFFTIQGPGELEESPTAMVFNTYSNAVRLFLVHPESRWNVVEIKKPPIFIEGFI
jgi:hypothetical protein